MDVHLVDGTYELFRHFYALPSARDQNGREVAAVRGVLASVLGMIKGGATRFTTHLLGNGCIIFLRSTMLWLLRHIVSESIDCTFSATAESHSKQKVVT